jgi:branched-chain amino acid transport system substrate-binding protein
MRMPVLAFPLIVAVLTLPVGPFPAPAIAAEPIKLGGLLETSGFIASLGNPGLEGARLAADQINAAGGINGRPLELVNLNTESDETKSVTAAKRLIEQEQVVAIVGPMSSGSNFSIIDTVQRARVPLMANGASRSIVLPPDQKRWIFLAPLTDVLVQGKMLEHMKKHGVARIALLNSDVAFGTSGREQLERLSPQHGVQVAIQQTAGNTDQDMTPQLTRIRGSDAQATVIWGTGPFLAIATKNHRQLGIKTPLYVSHAGNDFNYLRLAGDAANDVLIPSSKIYVAAQLPSGDPQRVVIERFVADYEKKYGRKPATFAGNGYDSVMMIAAAIRQAGPDRDRIRDALEGLKGHVGVTAVYTYSPQDHFGAQPDSVVMLHVRHGAFELAR